MSFYTKTVAETFREIGSSREGLTGREARKRLQKFGPNAIDIKSSSLLKKVVEPFTNLMIGVLVAAGALSFYHREYVDATIVFAIIMISAVIDWAQQYSTSRILRSLRKRENEPAEVLRDGNVSSVAAENLVPGDVIVLHEGQKIPADARVVETDSLQIDEAVLTGESVTVHKVADAFAKGVKKEVYEQANMLFSGSFVSTGSGVAVVVATGGATEFGAIAKLAGHAAGAKSPLQQKVDKMVQYVIIAVFGLAIVAFGLELTRGVDPVEALKFVLAFAVSAVPESLPIAITVISVLGMRRMAEKKALVRNMRAIENLGLVTTIATDKTGTLTENKLRVQDVWAAGLSAVEFVRQSVFALNATVGKKADPLDFALEKYFRDHHVAEAGESATTELLHVLAFDYEFAMSGNIWRRGARKELYLKGAPEKILERCAVTRDEARAADAKLHEFAREGYRVIAFARMPVAEVFADFDQMPCAKAEFLGLAAIADDLRPGVEKSVAEARRAGIEVRMITGDHIETALSVARKVGIANRDDEAFDSRELMAMDSAELAERVENAKVFARVIPEAKHKILTELNRTNITAMTGDGANDVPALAQANVGVAMGSGAAIAKDAADVVLLDDNFKSIVAAIREGRVIFTNIRRMLVYLLATNGGEVLVTLGALFFGLPLPLLAVQILWVNLATDTFMLLPLGLEAGAPDIMRRRPNRPDAPILDGYLLSRIVLVSASIAGITLGIYALFLGWHSEAEARSAAFLVLVVIQWVNAFAMRGEIFFAKLFHLKNRIFTFALVGTFVLQVVMLATPLRNLLALAEIHSDSWLFCVLGAAAMLAVVELHKFVGRKFFAKSSAM